MAEELKINHALRALSKKENGHKALEILCIITYFSPENINTESLLGIVNDEQELEASIELLKQFSLVYYGDNKTVINLYKTAQKVMITIIEKQNNKFAVLKKAFGLLFMQGMNSLNINHAISVWNHLTSYPQQIEKFTGLASCIVEELSKQNKYEEGHSFGLKALDFVKKVLGKRHTGTWVLQHSIGFLLAMSGKHEKSLELLLPLYENDKEHGGLRETLITIARQLGELSRFDEALKIFQKSIFCNKKVSEANDDPTLSAWHEYAHLLRDMERYHEASEILKGILERRRQISNTQDDDTLSLKSSLAHVLVKESKYSEALKIFHHVFDRRKIMLGKNHALTLKSRRDIALVFQHQGKLAEALAIYEEVSEKLKKTLGTGHLETLAIQANLATLLEQTGDYQKALGTYRYIYKKQCETLGEKDPDTLGVKYHIVTILFLLEQHDEALQSLKEVYEEYIEVFGENHEKTLDLRTTLETLNSVKLETIFSAAWEGNLNKVRSMIQSGIDLNNTDFQKKTPLHYAAEHGHASVVEILLKNGAIYNAECEGGKTPFQITKNSEVKNLFNLVAKLIKDARDGNHEQVSKHIAKQKGIVNAKDNDGSNALHWAAYNGHKNIVKLLVENGADATRVTNKGNTPLHIATSKGHAEIIEVLIQHTSRNDLHNFINAKTTAGGVTSIHVAAKNGFPEIVKSLLKHGAIYNIKNKQGKTPLQVSKDQSITSFLKLCNELFQNAKDGNPEIINKLQRVKPDELIALTSARNDEGNTLLQVTISNKHENIASEFLKIVKKSDQTESCSNFKYNLHQIEKLKRAAELHIKFSEIFLTNLRSLSQSCDTKKNLLPWITLMEGSFYLEKVYQFLQEYRLYTNGSIDNENIQAIDAALVDLEFDPKHINVGYPDETFGGQVECFVSKGQGKKYYELLFGELKKDVRLFIELAERGINDHVKKFLELLKQKLKDVVFQKLFKVIENNNYFEVEDCIREGADVNSKNTDGGTPLHYAVNNGNLDIIKFLLKNGADVTQVTAKGNTPLHIATAKGHKEIVQVLLQNASRDKLNDFINAQTTIGGTTSLHVAAKNGSVDIVKCLLKHGAIFNIENKEGKRPVDLSQDQNIINLLESTKTLFQSARDGNFEIISNLQYMEPDDSLALRNARDNQGNTVLQVAKNNKHKNIENILFEMSKKSDQTQSRSSLESRLDKLRRLENKAEVHIEFSEIYLPQLRKISEQSEREKNDLGRTGLEEASYYLENAYNLVKEYKNCMNGLIDDENIQAVHDMLVELQFDPEYNTVEYTNKAHVGRTKCFVSKGQGTKYYELLHGAWNRDLVLFIRLVESKIDVPVKRFLESIKRKLEYVLPEKLFKAVENNNHSEMENCIREEGLVVNVKNSDGATPLHFAVNSGNLDIIKILLKSGADVTQVTTKGNTPLHIATSRGFKEIVEVLLQHASHNELNDLVNAQTTVGGTASLHIAAKNGCVDVVKSLLKHGAIYAIQNKEGKSPLDFSKDLNVVNLLKLANELFESAKNGNFEIISKLHNAEPDDFIALTNARDNEGNTLLQVAIKNKYKSITSEFIELFEKPDKVQSWSGLKSKLEQFRMLQEVADVHVKISQLYILELRRMSEPGGSEKISSPSITLENGSYYLRNAHNLVEICKCCANSSIDNENVQAISDMLIALEFDPEYVTSRANEDCGEKVDCFVSKGQGKQYYKLLHSGLKKDVRLFIKLVDRNIEINVKKILGSIRQKLEYLLPENLFEAIENNNNSEVESLIKDGVDVNSKNADGRTPLHYAVNSSNLEMINFLLKHGADYIQVTTKGDTPLHIASTKDLKEIVKALLQHVSPDKLNGFINAQTIGGNTSLHIAAKNNSWDIVKCLLIYGAIYNIRNKEGKTPLDISTNQNITHLLKLISELFQDAKNGFPGILNKLQSNEGHELMALTSACNDEGYTLLQIAATNEHKNTVGKFSEAFEKAYQTLFCPIPKLKLDQIENIKTAAESCIKCSESYLPMLRNTSQPNRSEKNSFPWATLKAGSYYLRNVHGLVEVYKGCMNGAIHDPNIQAVNNILLELEFDPTHITLGYTDEAFDGKVECFVSKGQGTKYYELLHSKLKKDVRSFVEIIEPNINTYVKQFLKSIKQKLLTFLSEILFDAIKNNNNFEVKNCLREELVVNCINTDGKTPLHYAVNNGNVSIINTLLKHGADVSRVDGDGTTPLHVASSKGDKKVVDILLQYVNQDRLNYFINAQCEEGNTSLHIAANNGSLEVVEFLLQYGAIYNIKNQEGKTALDLSNDQNVTNLLKLIENLFKDAKNGSFKIFRKLKTQNDKFIAIKNTRNEQGKSLVQVAIDNKHPSLACKLETIIKTSSNSTGC